jgi:integrase/recombinase XerD
LERRKVSGDKILLFTAKTGVPVHLPIPPHCVAALEEIPANGTGYFFWSGQGKIKVRVGNYQAYLKKLFEIAKVTKGTAHRFRHTFAVSLLMKGVPVERVAILLGHSSTKVTQRHYSSWIAARQEQLEKDVRSTWENEPYKTATNDLRVRSDQ